MRISVDVLGPQDELDWPSILQVAEWAILDYIEDKANDPAVYTVRGRTYE